MTASKQAKEMENMKINQLIEKLGGNRAAIALNAGISIQQLNNMVYKNVDVAELKNGSFVVVRKDAVYFNKMDG